MERELPFKSNLLTFSSLSVNCLEMDRIICIPLDMSYDNDTRIKLDTNILMDRPCANEC